METSPIDPARLPELYEAICQLHASLELNEVIDRTLQAAIKLTGAERAFIWMPDRYSFYARPQLKPTVTRLILKSLETMRKDVEQAEQSISIADTQGHPFFTDEPMAALFASRTMLIVTLQASSKFLGALLVDRVATGEHFRAADRALLESLAIQAATAIRASRYSETMLSKIALRLRTSTISIKGYTDIFWMTGQLTDTQKGLLQTIQSYVDFQFRFTHELYEIFRIDSGRLHLELKAIDLRNCVENCLIERSLTIKERASLEVGSPLEDVTRGILPLLQSRQIVFILKLPSSLPQVFADFNRVKQIIALLIAIAIDFTRPDDQIELSVEVQSADIRLSLKETLNPKNKIDLTQRFQMMKEPPPGQSTLCSFGLAKNLIELMGGVIGFESEPGQGSTFWFTLPIAEQDDPAST